MKCIYKVLFICKVQISNHSITKKKQIELYRKLLYMVSNHTPPPTLFGDFLINKWHVKPVYCILSLLNVHSF